MVGPGAVTDNIAVLAPTVFKRLLSASRVHGGIHQPDGSPPAFSRAEKYQCIDMVLQNNSTGIGSILIPLAKAGG